MHRIYWFPRYSVHPGQVWDGGRKFYTEKMKQPNVWLVDDDEIYVHVTKKVLAHLSDNIQLQSYENGALAITALKKYLEKGQDLPDIILLDINMPELNGWGFLTEFKKLKSDTPSEIQIYMVTSSKDQRDQTKAKEYPELSGYLVKPVFEDQLVSLLTERFGDEW